MISELENTIQHYAWGSHHALSDLRGAPSPTLEPEAEIWMGAHPSAPSRLRSTGESLPAAVERAPLDHLGPRVTAAYDRKLPFLLKLLAAETPLSLQAHPTIAQASAGYAADEAAGIALDAPDRSYKDPNHKPELLCALSEFWALCGFRDVPSTLALLDELGVPQLAPYRALLARSPSSHGLAAVFAGLMQAPVEEQRALSLATTSASRATAERSERFREELRWATRLGDLYPGDVGVVSALLLNLLRLAPGEAIYLPAGNLHAYLGGTGVELMASSDNVLRGGLTPKHVNVAELLRVLDFRPLPAQPLHAVTVGAEHTYETPAHEFRLSYFDLAGAPLAVPIDGPEIWLVTAGELELADDTSAVVLSPGRSAFVSANSATVRVSGAGTVYRAAVAHSG